MKATNKELKTKKQTVLNHRLELDTAGTLFPLVFKNDYKSLVRFNVVMRDKINKSNLQTALNNLVSRFPSIFVRLNHDRHNYFLQTLIEAPKIIEDNQEPFLTTLEDLYCCAFKIMIFDNVLIFEFFHAISDGYGASVFLRTLLAEYIRIEYGVSCEYDQGTLNPLESSKQEETNDDLTKIITSKNKTKGVGSAYRIKGKTDTNLNVANLIYKSSELQSCARRNGVTLTALLSAVLGRALVELKIHQRVKRKEIKLSIPVDLRRRFDSVTLRNFSIPTTIRVEKSLEKENYAKLFQSLDKQIKGNFDGDNLKKMVTMYVKLSSNQLVVRLPLSLKRFGVRAFYALFKNTTTMTLTNLGIFTIPSKIEAYILDVNFMISPKPNNPYTCAIVSFGDTLTLTIASSLKDNLLETIIKRELSTLLNL